jgi:hypothetical protein
MADPIINHFKQLEEDVQAPAKIKNEVQQTIETTRSAGLLADLYVGVLGKVLSDFIGLVTPDTRDERGDRSEEM